MPTFTMVISDEPFDARTPGKAPFVESIEHGAGSGISTPATEGFRRCLDAIAGNPVNVPVADDVDIGKVLTARDIVRGVIKSLLSNRDDLDWIIACKLLDESALRDARDRDELEDKISVISMVLEKSIQSLREIADGPKWREDDA